MPFFAMAALVAEHNSPVFLWTVAKWCSIL